MKTPSCPNCGTNLLWRGLRRSDREFDGEGKKWYQFAGFRGVCPSCGVRLRSRGSSAFWVAFVFVILANAVGAHSMALRAGGYIGVGMLYLVWIVILVGAACAVQYETFDAKDARAGENHE